jgi:predicted DNA-binding protein with PD1-like motif
MQYTEAKTGRVFIVKLEPGEIIHESIEKVARTEKITAGAVLIVGGGGGGDSRLVVGPVDSSAARVTVMEHMLDDAHELTGAGTLVSAESGEPVLHMHISAGRGDSSVTGCIRRGVRVWGALEVTIVEFTGAAAFKKYEEDFDNYMLYTGG